MTYLLDTNACIVYMRSGPISQGVAARIRGAGAGTIGLCSVVVAELYFGVWRSTLRTSNLEKLTAFLQGYESLPFDDRAAEVYGKVRAELAQEGRPIGPNDLMIASIAIANGLILVSHNTPEFGRVSGLQVEDWQAS